MLTLVIKGNTFAAYEAASAVGVSITPIGYYEEWDETVATASESDRNKIALTWFARAPHEAPFPAGHLLWYGTRVEHERQGYVTAA